MRLQTSLIVAAAAAALTLNIYRSVKSGEDMILADIQMTPIVIEPEDELTIALHQQAQSAMAELQARRSDF